MRVLLDNNVNWRFARLLPNHEVDHVQDVGWERLQNGSLLTAAEEAGYAALITADKNIQHQQNMKGRTISIIVLGSLLNIWSHIEPFGPQVN